MPKLRGIPRGDNWCGSQVKPMIGLEPGWRKRIQMSSMQRHLLGRDSWAPCLRTVMNEAPRLPTEMWASLFPSCQLIALRAQSSGMALVEGPRSGSHSFPGRLFWCLYSRRGTEVSPFCPNSGLSWRYLVYRTPHKVSQDSWGDYAEAWSVTPPNSFHRCGLQELSLREALCASVHLRISLPADLGLSPHELWFSLQFPEDTRVVWLSVDQWEVSRVK